MSILKAHSIIMIKQMIKSIKHIKRWIIALIGFTILAIGIAMIILPGPAMIVIPIGLGILAIEFGWARSLLEKVKTKSKGGGNE